LAKRLVVAARIERQLAQDLALHAEHADVAVGDEHEHAPALVDSAEADVVKAAAIAQRDGPARVDLLVADPVVARRRVAVALRLGLDAGPEGLSRRPAGDLARCGRTSL